MGELGRILLVAGREHDPDPGRDFAVRLHTEGHRDLRVVVDRGTATLAWADDDADDRPSRSTPPPASCSSGADDRGRVRSHLDQPDLARLQTLLSGY